MRLSSSVFVIGVKGGIWCSESIMTISPSFTFSPSVRSSSSAAEHLPLVDFHCHIPPKDVYEDVRFDNLAQVWLGGENPDGTYFGDHYKWRVMRSNGVSENEITGNADNKLRIRKFAEALELAIGNPMYHWSNLELHKFFGVEEPLTPENSDRIYDLCADKLRNDPNMSVRGLIRQSNVAFIGTTDDPIDSLEWHKRTASRQEHQWCRKKPDPCQKHPVIPQAWDRI